MDSSLSILSYSFLGRFIPNIQDQQEPGSRLKMLAGLETIPHVMTGGSSDIHNSPDAYYPTNTPQGYVPRAFKTRSSEDS